MFCFVLFCLVNVSSDVQAFKFKSHLFIFAFVSFLLGERSTKICYNLSKNVKEFGLCSAVGVLWFQVLNFGL